MNEGNTGPGAGIREEAGSSPPEERSGALLEALRRQATENAELRSAATLGNRARVMATAAVIAIFVFIGGWSWMAMHLDVRELDTVLGLDGGGRAAAVQTMQVAEQPLTNAINLTGTLEPGQVVNLVAPFAGQVEKIDFTFGARVGTGQTLLALDTAEVEVQLREAENTLIQARQKLTEVTNWRTSPTVASAQRSLEQARMSLSQAQQNFDQTQALFEKGIVSRQERDSANTTFQNARISVAGAQEAVSAAKQQGDSTAVEMARLTYENAKFKYDSLKRKVARAEIKAPVSGIVLRPVDTGGGRGGDGGGRPVAAGAPVAENQILLSIGDLQTLSIASNISEFSIGQVKPGLKVNVTSDALPGLVLTGAVTAVSAQAQSTGGSVPTFNTVVTVKDLPDDARQRIRVGMSANLQVVVYENPSAIVVPFSAVLGGPGHAQVLVVPAHDAQPRPTAVELGERTAAGIEVKSGLKAGQTIVTNASSATLTAAN